MGKERRDGKFADAAKRGVFLGYQDGHHNYRVMLLEDKRIVYSHDVLFNENVFPLRTGDSAFEDKSATDSCFDFIDDPMEDVQDTIASPDLIKDNVSDQDRNGLTDSPEMLEMPSSVFTDPIVPDQIVEGDLNSQCVQTISSEPKASREISSNIDTANILPHGTRRSARHTTVQPQALLTSSPDPKTYHQALKMNDAELWIDAMNRELSALERMGVWEEVILPANEHALGTTWVYKRKTGPSGELIK